MRSFINDNYHIQCIGIIQINVNVYRIKTIKNDYILKITSHDINDICHYLDSLNLRCFVDVIRNKKGEFLTCYNDCYCYLMKSVELKIDHYNKEKEKFYYETLRFVHHKTRCEQIMSEHQFNHLVNHIHQIIDQRLNYYDDLMCKYESDDYRSPSGWMFILNYYRINQILCYAKNLLFLFKEKKNVKLSYGLIYVNFDMNHISLKNQCLISIDHLSKNLLVYDIYDLLKKISVYHLDFYCFIELYLSYMKFNENEYLLIQCLMCLIPEIVLDQSEMNNIICLSYLLDYIDSLKSFLDKSLTK